VDLVAGIFGVQAEEKELRRELLLLEGLVAIQAELRCAHGLKILQREEGEGDPDASLLDGEAGVEIFGVEPQHRRDRPAVETTAELQATSPSASCSKRTGTSPMPRCSTI
jgi:hypothetical protein